MESCSFIQMTCRTVALPFSVFLMQQFAGLWAVQIEKTSISCRSASASVHTCVCLCARPQLCPIASVLKVYLAAATSARSVTNFTCRCRIIYGANILPCSLAESYYEFDLLNCLLSIACRSGTCLSLSRARQFQLSFFSKYLSRCKSCSAGLCLSQLTVKHFTSKD